MEGVGGRNEEDERRLREESIKMRKRKEQDEKLNRASRGQEKETAFTI